MERVGQDNFFQHLYDSRYFLRNSWKKWKNCQNPTFPTTQAVLEAQIVERVGQDNFFHHFLDSNDFLKNSWKKWKKLACNIFHDNFHCRWWLEASKPSEAIVPEIMEIMETVGFTNNSKIFCYQIHGNYWFQGRKHSKNLGQWGGTIYTYIEICIYICTCIYIGI